jgi:hypothetical protein
MTDGIPDPTDPDPTDPGDDWDDEFSSFRGGQALSDPNAELLTSTSTPRPAPPPAASAPEPGDAEVAGS